MLKNEVLIVDGAYWLVREAVSAEAARNTIAHVRVLGSVSGTDTETGTDGVRKVVADVVRLNDEGRERLPGGAQGADHSALVAVARAMAHSNRLASALSQSQLRGRVYGGALAELEALATVDMPLYHDPEFLRSEILRVVGEARATIAQAKAEYQAGRKA